MKIDEPKFDLDSRKLDSTNTTQEKKSFFFMNFNLRANFFCFFLICRE